MKGVIFDIKEMAVHDGPGIRTTVFLKGCPLRCAWCHNPEGLSKNRQLMYKETKCVQCGACRKKCEHEACKPYGRCIYVCPENALEIAGREVDTKTLAKELRASADVLGDSFGGFTFSGGEPLFQPEFLLELIEELKGYHLCIETSGFAKNDVFETVLAKLDFVIFDVKIADSNLHKKYTGQDNRLILENLKILQNSGKPLLIRTPLIAGITDTIENLEAIKKLIGESPWEKLPQNEMAGAKYKMLGMEYLLK